MIRREASLQPASLPSRETIGRMWAELKAKRRATIGHLRNLVGDCTLGVKKFPDRMQWLYSSHVSAPRERVWSSARLLDYYTDAERYPADGLLTHVASFGSFRAAVNQFSPKRKTLTQRVLQKIKMSR